MLNEIISIDRSIIMYIQENLRTSFGNSFFAFYTSIGNAGICWIILTLILLFIRRTRKAGLASAIALILSLLTVNLLLKNIVLRPRPFMEMSEVILFIPPPFGTSFPSGHSSSSFAAAVAIFPGLSRRLKLTLGIPCFAAAALMAFSRIYAGVHYPSDVLFGSLWGVILGLSGYALAKYFFRKKGWDSIISDTSDGVK
ncbi:MAG: phosphatase PAP2 family protein [Huintestinicola sp.]